MINCLSLEESAGGSSVRSYVVEGPQVVLVGNAPNVSPMLTGTSVHWINCLSLEESTGRSSVRSYVVEGPHIVLVGNAPNVSPMLTGSSLD